ncbi:MAG TPA: methylated-DNA--[protein]-cysteine S-methyltransferase [Mycobacteriales bacterium]|nr:methylated-DNA--[protein]-cysteine S-methyltransferase [Mycobacteriales bacterium]
MGRVLYTVVPSPVGDLLLLGDGQAITALGRAASSDHPAGASPPPGASRDGAAFRAAAAQLRAYFAGELRHFDVPVAPRGTPFQHEVWAALREIPYGETTSYGALALSLGRPLGAARAVGAANARNPILILIPCHRVLGTDGALRGYAGSLPVKRALLAREQVA